jgi:hypothetical protein
MSDVRGQSERENEELTRREWLLRLGQSVALMGFSGVTSEAIPETASHPGPASSLPPGLYTPSNEHLGHALTRDERFLTTPPGSKTDYVRPRNAPYEPQFFSPTDFQVIHRIVATILGEAGGPSTGREEREGPREDIGDELAEWIDLTVAHSAAVRDVARRLAPEYRILAVHYYGAKAVEELENRDPQTICREGIDWLIEESVGRYHRPFPGLSEEQQVDLLSQISDDRPDKSVENAGTRFFDLIKSAVIHGFYTSRAGLKELGYKGNAFYAASPGCSGA